MIERKHPAGLAGYALGFFRIDTRRWYYWNEPKQRWIARRSAATLYRSQRSALRADLEAERVRLTIPELSHPLDTPYRLSKRGGLSLRARSVSK